MKKIILLVLCAIPSFLFAQEGTYTINGKVGKLNSPAKAYLFFQDSEIPDSQLLDSAAIKNGVFVFTGVVKADKAVLIVSHDGTPYSPKVRPSDYIQLYIEPVKFSATSADSIKNASIKGSPVNEENSLLEASLKPFKEKLNALMSEYQSASEEGKKTIQTSYYAIQEEMKGANLTFIKSNPGSIVSMTALNTYAGPSPDITNVEPIFNALSPKVKNSKAGKAFAEKLDKLKKVAIGAIAPDFTQNDPNGNPIKLSDFRGKYLLIDFWASWCGPCRKENPNVVKAYAQFKDKNFEILGVSLDQPTAKEAWLKAIEKDGLTWPQVSDLKFWKNEAAQLYAVQSIPQNFLLDPSGKIIAKNLRGEELAAKLAELIK